MSKGPKLLEAIGAIVLVVGLAIPAGLLTAVVACDFWRWFVMPLGAPEVGLLHMIGLILALRLAHSPADKDSEPGRNTSAILADALGNLLGRALAVLSIWGAGALIAWGMA